MARILLTLMWLNQTSWSIENNDNQALPLVSEVSIKHNHPVMNISSTFLLGDA